MHTTYRRLARALAAGLVTTALRANRRSALVTRHELDAFEGLVGGPTARTRVAVPSDGPNHAARLFP